MIIVESPEQRLKRLVRPGDLVMRFLEDESRDGEPHRSISFVGIDFKPLGYEELAGARLHLPVTVPLDGASARVAALTLHWRSNAPQRVVHAARPSADPAGVFA